MKEEAYSPTALDLPMVSPLPDATRRYFEICAEKLGLIPNVLKAYAFDIDKLNAFAALLPQDKEFEVIGPMPAPLDKKAGKFRRQLLFQAKNRNRLQQEFERIHPLVEQLIEAKRCRWSLDRDPQDLL